MRNDPQKFGLQEFLIHCDNKRNSKREDAKDLLCSEYKRYFTSKK